MPPQVRSEPGLPVRIVSERLCFGQDELRGQLRGHQLRQLELWRLRKQLRAGRQLHIGELHLRTGTGEVRQQLRGAGGGSSELRRVWDRLQPEPGLLERRLRGGLRRTRNCLWEVLRQSAERQPELRRVRPRVRDR
jgi:hypothetical protein